MDPLLSRPDEIRVLHVDDDRLFLDTATAFVERETEDVAVIPEIDPEAALERFAAERFDCVVSDYDMPAVNGLELLRRIRERDTDVPFVLYTGKGSEEIAAEAIQEGVDAYIPKETGSAQYAVLANRIRSLVDQLWATRRARQLEQVYELVARTATDAFWVREMETEATHYSEGVRQFGYEPGVRDDGFEWWVERVHPDQRETARRLNERQQLGAPEGFDDVDGQYGEFTFSYPWRCADGEYVQLRSRGIVRFEDGNAVEMVGAMTRVDGPDRCGKGTE